MARFTIYSALGVAKYSGYPTFTGTYMKPGTLEFREIASPTPIEWAVGDYVDYPKTGLRYKLYSIPQLKKQAQSGKYGAAYVYQNVQFFDASYDLEICPFRDLVKGDNRVHFSTQPMISVFDNVAGIAERLQVCLEDMYGAGSWVVRAVTTSDWPGQTVPSWLTERIALMSEDRNYSVEGVSILGALDKVYEVWPEIGWVFKVVNGQKTIIIGGAGLNLATAQNYAYGKGNGLKNITRVSANKDELANRIYAYGSNRNMLSGWYRSQNIKDAESVDIQHLMIPVSDWGETDGLPDAAKAFVEDAASIARIGLRPKTVYFDGTGDTEEIYPTIQGMKISDVIAAVPAGQQYSPNTSIYTDQDVRVDVVRSVESVFDSGLSADSGKQTILSEYGNIAYNTALVIPAGETQVAQTIFTKTITAPETGSLNLAAIFSLSGGVLAADATVSAYVEAVDASDNVIGKSVIELVHDGNSWEFESASIAKSGLSVTSGQTITLRLVVKVTSQATSESARNYATAISGELSASLQRFRAQTFKITLRQIGFDISAQAALGSGKTIHFRSGKCAGRSFTIKDCSYQTATDSWLLEVIRSEDSSLSQWFPNNTYPVEADDEFVLLDIAMPDSYVLVAENKLLAAAEDYLDWSAKEIWQYTPEIDAKFMVENNRMILPAEYINLTDSDVVEGDAAQLVDTITINEGESALPSYKITLRERKRVNTSSSGTVESASSSPVASSTAKANVNRTSSFFEEDGNGNVKLKDEYAGLWAYGFMVAGGVGPGGGGGGGDLDLARMWASLTNSTPDEFANTLINALHIPVATAGAVGGIKVGSTLTIADGVLNVPVGSVAMLEAGTDEVGRIWSAKMLADYVSEKSSSDILPVAMALAALSGRVSSIEDWINAPSFDELYSALVNADEINLGGLILNSDTIFSALANENNNIAITIAGIKKTLEVGYAKKALNDKNGNDIYATYVSGVAIGAGAQKDNVLVTKNGTTTALTVPFATVAQKSRFTPSYEGASEIEVLLDWFVPETYTVNDETFYRLRLNPKYAGMYADGWIVAGGVGSGGGGGGDFDLSRMWDSLTNTTVDEYADTPIHIAHIPNITVSKISDFPSSWAWSAITNKPTTLSGYGITDAYTKAQVDALIEGIDNDILPLTEGVASLFGRVGTIEDWILSPSFDELYSALVNTDELNLGGLVLINNEGVLNMNGAALLSALASTTTTPLSITVGGKTLTLAELVATKFKNGVTFWGAQNLGSTVFSYTGNLTGTGNITTEGKVTAESGFSLGGVLADDTPSVLEWDDTNKAWKLTGNFYATGFVVAGGVGTSGSSDFDLDRMWASLTNTEVDTYATAKISTSHLPTIEYSGSGIVTALGYRTENGETYLTVSRRALTVADISDLETWYTGKFGSVASGNTGIVTGGQVYAAINTAISSAIKFQGITTTALTDGSTTNPITIDGASYTANRGDEVIYGGLEFLWTGSKWQQLGDEQSWALKTVTITGTGYITGGGNLEANRTLDLTQTVKNKIDAAITENQTITLSGVVSGSGKTSITTSIANGNITNAMLANSSLTIAGLSVSLGGSISASDLLNALDLSDVVTPLAEGVANLSARVSSLEDWLLTPAMDEAYIALANVDELNLGGNILTSDGSVLNWNEGALFSALSSSTATPLSLTVGGKNLTLSALVATRLTTVSKTAWGQTFWTANGVPDSISGNISNAGNITPATTGASNLGSDSLAWKRLYLGNGVYFEYDSDNGGVQLVGAGFYTQSYVTAGGVGGGGTSDFDLDRMWASLTNEISDDYANTAIDLAHIPSLPISRISDAETWISGKGYLTENQTITLTGDVTGSGKTSIATTIGTGKVTNAMLAGSIANGKLQNSAITIAGTSVSLGGSISADTILAALDLADVVLPLAEGISGLSGRVSSIEDWIVSPDAEDAFIANLNTEEINLLGNILGAVDTTMYWNGSEAFSAFSQSGATVSATIGGKARSLTLASIPNSALSNSSITINGTAVSLGGTRTITLAQIIGSSAIGSTSLPVYYNGSALVACTKGDVFSAISSSAATNISVTVAGQTRSVSDLYATYDDEGNNIATNTKNIELSLAEGIANANARIVSLEDWLANPFMEEAYIEVLDTANIYGLKASFGETLSVSGATSLGSTLGVSGATTLGSTLGVTGAATLSNNLTVSGTTTLNGSTFVYNSFQVGSAATNRNSIFYGYLYIGSATSYINYVSGNSGLHTNVGFYSDSYITSAATGSSSDRRMKDNIDAVCSDRALSVLMQLKPCEWEWNDRNPNLAGKRGAGLVAQDVADVLPFAVMDLGDYLYLNYSVLHAYEIAGLQNHESRIEALEKENAILKEKVKQLEAR